MFQQTSHCDKSRTGTIFVLLEVDSNEAPQLCVEVLQAQDFGDWARGEQMQVQRMGVRAVEGGRILSSIWSIFVASV